MFNEGILEFIWVLVGFDELQVLEAELTEAFGPVVYENATYRVFESGTVAARNDPPEILIATPALLRELAGYQSGD